MLQPKEWTYAKLGRTQIMLDAGTPLPWIPDWLNAGDRRLLRAISPLMQYADARRYMDAQNAETLRAGRPKIGMYELADYLDDAAALRLDLTNKTVLFPRNLRERHAATSAERKYRADEASRKRMQARADKLSPFAWERDGLLIRPATSAAELTAEGKALHHCVGTYSERYASGETEIWFVRRKEDPDTPFFTLEYRDGRIVQCRTLHNRSCDTEPAVKAFVTAWARRRKSIRLRCGKEKAAETAAS